MQKLIFFGEIVQGFERDQVVTNLANLLKQSPDTIDRNLFAGKPVVVKRVASETIASKWIKAFADAGAVLQSEADKPEQVTAATTVPSPLKPLTAEHQAAPRADVPPAVETSSAAYSGVANHRLARKRHKAFLALGLIMFLVLAVLVFALWATRPLWQSPQINQQQQALVNALASDDIFALAHINVGHIQSLEALAQRETDLATLPGVDEGFWSSLEQAGIRMREQVEHVWIAGYASSQSGGAQNQGNALLVITGKFNPSQIQQWLKQRYIVEAENADGYLLSWLDERTCEKQPAKQAVISAQQILVGSPAQVAEFQRRLKAGAAAAIDLTDWQAISSTQLASLAVFVPKNLGTAVGGLPGFMIREAAATAVPASGFYLGLDPVFLPPGVEVSVTMTSDDAGFLQEAKAGVSAGLEEAKSKAAESSPETLPLYERLTINHTGEQLRAAIRFDGNLQQELSDWISAFFSASFTAGSSSQDSQAEKVDENPPQFTNVGSTRFPDFADQQYLDSSFNPVAVSGPFGIELRHLEISEEGAGIALDFRAFNLPNVSAQHSPLSVRVVDVLDRAGNSLAPPPACGPDKLRAPVPITSAWSTTAYIEGKEVPHTTISGSTNLRLPSDVFLSDVAAITGVFDYQLPRAVETIELTAPLLGRVIEQHGLRLRFLAGSEGSLRYEVSGKTEHLLYVAALNAEGKPLEQSSSMRSGMLFGSGQSVTASYKGQVSGARVYVASDLVHLSYPFKIASLQPAAGDATWPLKPQPVPITDSQWQVLRADTPPQGVNFWRPPQSTHTLGPILLAVQDVSAHAHFGLQLDAEAYVRNNHPLAGIVAVAGLAVSELTRANGETQAVQLSAQFPLDYDGGYWMNGEFNPNSDSPWLRGKVQLRDSEIKVTDVKSLRGTVSLNRALATQTIYLPSTLGTHWENEQFGIRLMRWEKGRLVFTVTGNLTGLVSIQALDADGVIVSHPADQSWMFGKAEVRLDIQAIPKQLALVIADSTESLIYPFEIILSE